MLRTTLVPSCSLSAWRDCCFLATVFIFHATFSQTTQFVTRSSDTLQVAGRPFYFLGANAYYLLEQSARGDTTTVNALFSRANSLNMTVVRTWGFYDSSDSLDPAVVQYRPGSFNERALRGLDYVVLSAKRHNLRLLLPMVNSWDDYGGMNQYVRWRSQATTSNDFITTRFSQADQGRIIESGTGRQYRFAQDDFFGHDDFYVDTVIKTWYRNYIATLLNRVNVYTGVQYKNEPAIFGWELANEPRSTDQSGQIVYRWAAEIAAFIKSIDTAHLVGTGEEGFDISSSLFSIGSYGNQRWLFDGTEGVSFTANSSIPSIDFGSCHLYPELWNLTNGAGNTWIRDHIRAARSLNKPLIVGEFGVIRDRIATYDSWLSTSLFDGAAGAVVWQFLEGSRTDDDGFGIRCPSSASLCGTLSNVGLKFCRKSQDGFLPIPSGFSLYQNYPNPFNSVTTVPYTLAVESYVDLSVFDVTGREVISIIRDFQAAGERKELLDAGMLASGAYVYRLVVSSLHSPLNRRFSQTRKMIVLR